MKSFTDFVGKKYNITDYDWKCKVPEIYNQ
jgi:hypothetical protein